MSETPAMRGSRILLPCLALAAMLVACQAPSATPAHATATATPGDTTVSVNGAELRARTILASELNATVAERYGLQRDANTLVVLVMLRDASGNALPASALDWLEVKAGVLPDAPQPLAMRAVQVDGFVDYLGTVSVNAPATVQVSIAAKKGGSTASQSFTRDLLPR